MIKSPPLLGKHILRLWESSWDTRILLMFPRSIQAALLHSTFASAAGCAVPGTHHTVALLLGDSLGPHYHTQCVGEHFHTCPLARSTCAFPWFISKRRQLSRKIVAYLFSPESVFLPAPAEGEAHQLDNLQGSLAQHSRHCVT